MNSALHNNKTPVSRQDEIEGNAKRISENVVKKERSGQDVIAMTTWVITAAIGLLFWAGFAALLIQ